MRRADRLFSLIQALRGGRLRTASWLAEQLEVSTRTIYRDIADLQANGTPIDGERGIGYLLRGDYFLPPLALTGPEHEALRWGLALVSAHGDETLGLAAREVLVKLGVHQAPFHAPPTLTPQDRHMLKAVREGLAAQQRLHLVYKDLDEAPSERSVRPLGMEHWGKVWTLTAWCELRGDFRVFRIDRIVTCALGTHFAHEAGKRLEDYLAQLRAKTEDATPQDK